MSISERIAAAEAELVSMKDALVESMKSLEVRSRNCRLRSRSILRALPH